MRKVWAFRARRAFPVRTPPTLPVHDGGAALRTIVPLLAPLLLFTTAAPAMAADAPAPLALSVRDAVLMSLERNRGLLVQRYQPEITRTGEDQAAAAFDLGLSGDASGSWNRTPLADAGGYQTSDTQELTFGLSRLLASGTTLGLELDASRAASPEAYTTRLGLSVTQALLQGRGADVNLVEVRQARLDTASSVYELRGLAEALVAQVEQACWDSLLSARSIAIVERSLKLAEDQLAEVRERIAVGRVAESELAAAEAEVAVRSEALINARSSLARARLNLAQLVNPPGENPLGREIAITDQPELSPPDPDPVESHVALAERFRNDLNQARLSLERGELAVVRTRNGLLPKLDFFLSLGKTGYAAAFADSVDLGGRSYDAQAGLTLRFPWQNREARAADRRAVLTRDQAAASLENLAQLVEVDVRGAWIEAGRLREQVAATAATQRLQREKLRSETEKFRVGKSTAFLVAQAQRDLLQAELESETAVAGLLKAVVECYRLEGSLLDRRGISVADR
jgi:outer membrane protein TolC